MAAWMPFQRVENIRTSSESKWVKLGFITEYSAVSFIYSNITYVNVKPAIYAVVANNYNGSFNFNCKLIVGLSGGAYENNIKYKYENNKIHVWVTNSIYYQSSIVVLTGEITVEGYEDTPPSDAIQPSV